LPHWVGVLLGAHIGLVDGAFMLITDIIDQHSTIIQTYGQ
jgi:hypothetical protein